MAGGDEASGVQDLAFFAFPTLEQLGSATEEALRASGFGYRCFFSSLVLSFSS